MVPCISGTKRTVNTKANAAKDEKSKLLAERLHDDYRHLLLKTKTVFGANYSISPKKKKKKITEHEDDLDNYSNMNGDRFKRISTKKNKNYYCCHYKTNQKKTKHAQRHLPSSLLGKISAHKKQNK